MSLDDWIKGKLTAKERYDKKGGRRKEAEKKDPLAHRQTDLKLEGEGNCTRSHWIERREEE